MVHTKQTGKRENRANDSKLIYWRWSGLARLQSSGEIRLQDNAIRWQETLDALVEFSTGVSVGIASALER